MEPTDIAEFVHCLASGLGDGRIRKTNSASYSLGAAGRLLRG